MKYTRFLQYNGLKTNKPKGVLTKANLVLTSNTDTLNSMLFAKLLSYYIGLNTTIIICICTERVQKSIMSDREKNDFQI